MSGKWGMVSPKWTKEIIKASYNRGYAQPLPTGGYVSYWGKTSWKKIRG